MTSKSSFFKLMKEDLRQRLWTIVLAAVVFVLPVPIYIAMKVSGAAGFFTGYQRNDVYRLVSPLAADSGWLVLVTIVGALICAVSGFGYLFSRKKTDFFHALPLRREKLFAVRYLNGLLIYLVPYLAMVLVSFVIIAVSGYFSTVVLSETLGGLVVHLLGYLTVYTTFILCVTFVGNIVIFFAVSGWTFGITAVVLLMYSWFEQCLFDTFCYRGADFMERLHSLRFLCPGYFYLSAARDTEAAMLLQQLAFTVVLCGIAVLVYRIRPAEGAGKAIAFPVLKPVIRVSVELLAGWLVGLLFYNMADRDSGVPGWMVFGGVLGVVLSHMLVQSIFHFDIRKCFANKISMVGCIVVAVGASLMMRYDLFGYDTYLPKEKQLESVAIEISALDSYRDSYRYNGNEIQWVNELEQMELTDIKELYPYLVTLVEDTQNRSDNGRPEEVTDKTPVGREYLNVDVAYHLKNGKTVYRSYWSDGLHEDVFAPVFESTEYKEIHYMDIYTMPEEYVQSATARCAMNEQEMSLSNAEKAELIAALRREVSALTLREKLHTLPVAVVELELAKEDGEQQVFLASNKIPVYASFTETLRFLEERGFQPAAEYEWTGREMMRVRFPEDAAKEGEAAYSVATEASWDRDWEYGKNTVPVEQEDYERLYGLCKWKPLFDYGDPTEHYNDDYTVDIDVPREGYNTYKTYRFLVPGETDLSFLFD